MNTLRTERDLQAALVELSDGAPDAADVLPSAAPQRASRRWLYRLAPVVAAAAVIALALTLVITGRPGTSSRGGPSGSSSNGATSDLVGIRWQVQTVGGKSADHGVALLIRANGWLDADYEVCGSVRAQFMISSSHLTFERQQLPPQACPEGHPLSNVSQMTIDAVDHMFFGTVSWSVRGDRLTLRKSGAPTIVYTRYPSVPATTRAWTFEGVGISVPASWPANHVRCSEPIADTVLLPAPRNACVTSRAPAVTSVEFSPSESLPDGPQDWNSFSVDNVEAADQTRQPDKGLHEIDVLFPTRGVLVEIISPSQAEAQRLESTIFIVNN
jgi:hypothetical protein